MRTTIQATTPTAAPKAFTLSYIADGKEKRSLDWRFPNVGLSVWLESDGHGKDRVPWRTLTEAGRLKLIGRFGLEKIADLLPLDKIAQLAPRELIVCRREIERDDTLPPRTIVSDQPYASVAEFTS